MFNALALCYIPTLIPEGMKGTLQSPKYFLDSKGWNSVLISLLDPRVFSHSKTSPLTLHPYLCLCQWSISTWNVVTNS